MLEYRVVMPLLASISHAAGPPTPELPHIFKEILKGAARSQLVP